MLIRNKATKELNALAQQEDSPAEIWFDPDIVTGGLYVVKGLVKDKSFYRATEHGVQHLISVVDDSVKPKRSH